MSPSCPAQTGFACLSEEMRAAVVCVPGPVVGAGPQMGCSAYLLCPLWGQTGSSRELRAGAEKATGTNRSQMCGRAFRMWVITWKELVSSARGRGCPSPVPGGPLGTASSSPTRHSPASLPGNPRIQLVVESSHPSLLAQLHSSHGIEGKIRLQRTVDSSAGKARGRQGPQTER